MCAQKLSPEAHIAASTAKPSAKGVKRNKCRASNISGGGAGNASTPFPQALPEQPSSSSTASINKLRLVKGEPILRSALRANNIHIKSFEEKEKCKFSKQPRYSCQVTSNDFGLDWLYSVPCGGCAGSPDGSWIFFNDADLPSHGSLERKTRIDDWLESLHWTSVTNSTNKRFMCPKCAPKTPMML